MKVTIKECLGCSPAIGTWYYICEAENGLINREEAKHYFPVGTTFNSPDDAWQPESEEFLLHCDGCGYEYQIRTVPGHDVECPVCGTVDRVPEGATSNVE